MRISQAKVAIKQLYKTKSVTALISERGVGKTSAYKQCAKELGIGYIDLYAAALEGPDFMGLPSKNQSIGITEYLAPRFLPTVEAIKNGLYPDSGILVLEEINRVPSDTVSVLYPLLLDRKINGHTLGENWRIGVTMNPDNMNYLVNTLDDAMLDRFITISIEPNIDDYIEYSLSRPHNKSVLEYLKDYPEMLMIINKNSSELSKSPTPRGWSLVQEVLNSCDFDDTIKEEVIAGIIGVNTSVAFWAYLNSYKDYIPKPGEILNNYSNIRGRVLELLSNNSVEDSINLINSIISNLENSLGSYSELNQFLNDLPKELLTYFYKELTVKKPKLLENISDQLESFEKATDDLIDLIVG
ncbi:hypothetical protein EW093_14405 [Thiospirochaeta perfilievii]|uniref:ATPase dynein-related AAA domain-containing protein n=1 Tax=Thiospirochaeta perfilievii TaxID=252967 RepID=A0A5C1QE29_9SPIO|nr:AAA family ATPase [Thiospirochaeta perfilievii]QEN05841.1 hypothetical protein EW093_14405 [Thiospirochaeta perfilievii]